MQSYKTVDEYIAASPKNVQESLTKIREIIKTTVPEAEERISYSMPFYSYHGRLVYFAQTKTHIGIYAIFEPVRKQFKDELKDYEMSKGTIRFPLNKPIPFDLIQRLIKAQAKWNEENKR
ncbi:MAG TPA: DUF1801 domain-containing protein [Patescibacteria group bacterium]|nr:DUF1801 domain-containing protein [Patescibacteria group bacterium]